MTEGQDVSDRRNPYREFDLKLITPFLDGRLVSSTERISVGKSNTNYRLSLSDGQTVVFRLYSENSVSSPQRDARIAEIIDGRLPVPAMLASGDDWAVFEFVHGTILSNALASVDLAAESLAKLSTIEFDEGGWINADGRISPFDFGDDYAGSMLDDPEVHRWIGSEQTQKVKRILRTESTRRSEIADQHVMVHGDFNPTNILIDSGRVSAVVDWEYAHAGTPYMDIGNLLRNIDSRYHEAVYSGLKSGGLDVPDDWKERAALVDLSSHLEFLTSTRSEEFKRTRVELIQEFVRKFEK